MKAHQRTPPSMSVEPSEPTLLNALKETNVQMRVGALVDQEIARTLKVILLANHARLTVVQ